VDRRRETPQVIVDQAIPVDKAVEQLTGSVTVRLQTLPDAENLRPLADLLQAHRGRCPIFLEVVPVSRGDVRAVVRPASEWQVNPTQEFYEQLCRLAGQENVLLRPRRLNGRANGPDGRGYYSARKTVQKAILARSGQEPG
jgi:hypothetical protein